MKIIPFICAILSFSALAQESEVSMINGISLVSEKELLENDQLGPIIEVNANWVAVIPYTFMPDKNEPDLIYDIDGQWQGERPYGIRVAIYRLKARGIEVMVKPQIWIGRGGFTGHIDMDTEDEWRQFEENYTKYILDFATIAEEEGAALFCIGTEMSRSAIKRPEYWKELILEVREVYSGKLTYAENWDSYTKVDFWKELDFIGIDAYFPICFKKKPSNVELMKNWKKLEKDIGVFSEEQGKKVLFTEYGYRSTDNCAVKPWDYGSNGNFSEEAQVKGLNALYNVMWGQPYFAGGFLWKWQPDHLGAGGQGNTAYTVQNKKAEQIVKEVYGR